ncbi:hypothetical protein [Lutibacter citreus]|uniref:hypothetical protein n=1 Tax=Lutibacter citreus TaxID=2138210 RepID=UPI0015D01F2C|nr:hypothetical protein [Lutibacter citreus]
MLFVNCSKDDDDQVIEQEIVFINSDGTLIGDGCLDPKNEYAVQITIKSNSEKLRSQEVINYTVNGNLYSVTFTELGTKKIPVNFIGGTNIIQVVNSDLEWSLYFPSQGDFELVE